MTGGPDSVYLADAKLCDPRVLSLGVPVLGICYGMQVIARLMGGCVDKAPVPEFGRTFISLGKHPLFKGLEMCIRDRVGAAPVPPRKPSMAMMSAPLRAIPLAMAATLWTAAIFTMTGF